MMVMREEDISLKGPKRVFQRDEGRLPVVDNFQIGDDFEEVLVPPAVLVTTERSGGIVYFGFIVEDSGDENYCDDVGSPRFPPLGEKRG